MSFGSRTQRGSRTQSQQGKTFTKKVQGTVTELENGQLEVLCEHGEPAVLLTANTQANPGRQFYKCNNAEKCGLFLWADEAEGKKRTGNSLTSSHATASTSNAREAASRAAQARAAPPPPASSPAKRPPSSPARGVIGRSNGPAIDIDGEVTEDEDDPVTAAEADGMLNDAEVLDEIAEVEEPARKKAKFSFGGGSSPAKGEEEDPFAAPATPASSQGKRSAAGSQSQWDRIRNDPASPFHARNEALKNAMSSPSSSQQSDTTMTPTALATDDALRQLDTLDSAFGGASPALAAIRKAITTEQRRAMAATKQKDTVVAIKDKEIAALKAEVASLKSRLSK